MLRVIKVIFIFLLLTISAVLFYAYKKNPIRTFPTTYVINNDVYTTNSIAEEADILIIGDNIGKSFDRQMTNLSERLSKNLAKPIKIYNLSVNNEGIHRTLAKIKKLKKLPPVVIYMGGGSEFFERLYPENLKLFKLNFRIYKNEYIQSLITIFPIISRFIYIPLKTYVLTEDIEEAPYHGTNWFQTIAESTFLNFQESFLELIDLVINNKSKFLIVVPPINLEADIGLACDASITDDITILQNEIKELITKKNFKAAANKVGLLNKISIANAQTKFLLGKIQLNSGQISKAKKNLSYAKAIDCDPLGPHPVINAIIKKTATRKNQVIIDFNELINRNLGLNTLFLDHRMPQFIYMQQLEDSMFIKLKGILKL